MPVYLLHFDRPLSGRAQHYIGFAKTLETLERRIESHRRGTSGAKIMDALHREGIGFQVARLWPEADQAYERWLKNHHRPLRFCPICGPAWLRREVDRQNRARAAKRGGDWIEGRGIAELLDVTGLDPRDASDLALELAKANGPGPIYKRRLDGKRRMVPGSLRVNLEAPILQRLGFSSELREAMRAGDIEIESREPPPDLPNAEWEALAEARYAYLDTL